MDIARAKGTLRGKVPKLSDRQQKELRRMRERATIPLATSRRCSPYLARPFTECWGGGIPLLGMDDRGYFAY
jgi:hypothetical protein